MRGLHRLNPSTAQFPWVVLLLAIAVILPTVCLLWFMDAVVTNERLVVRQKLIAVYSDELAEVAQEIDEKWPHRCSTLGAEERDLPSYQAFSAAVLEDGLDGCVWYDAAGRLLYPAPAGATAALTGPAEVFADAWELEFVDGQYERAAQRYEQYARISEGRARLAARVAKSRCLSKLGRRDDAIAECNQVATSPLAETGDAQALILIANARLLLLSWTRERPEYADLFEQTVRKLVSMLYRPNQAGAALPADQNLFVAQKTLEIARKDTGPSADAGELSRAALERLVAAEERSFAFAEQFPTAGALDGWPAETLQKPSLGDAVVYSIRHKNDGGTCVGLLADSTVAASLHEYAGGLEDAYVEYRILDETGQPVLSPGEPDPNEPRTVGEPFATAPLGKYFPGWTLAVTFKGGDVFERAAGEQIAVYTGTGLLVILLILLSGAVAAKSLGKQIRLNRLKNDFIATVTHELKTPLASMRVLVDTLLEGSYRDQQQVTEYLQLISRENERLSRLIDNFLTFSRMERNKQAFQMRPTPADKIARAAAEAVGTKLNRDRCRFDAEIPEGLPCVTADPDAMVTVLVNLLDNAYKYSYDDKHITLNVSVEKKAVCFRVRDNGIGIPRRSAKRVFKRFYQVDRRLSRRAEGCGLGLSIAKFIVDAHGGSIAVDSTPGQGSTFTVRLPVVQAATRGHR